MDDSHQEGRPRFVGAPLLGLAAVLEVDESLFEELKLVLHAPVDYLERFAERLDNRGIDSLRPDLQWFALIDGLIARGQARELDWKSSSQEVLENLVAIYPEARAVLGETFVADCEALPEAPRGTGMSLDFLTLAGGRFLARELALVVLVMDSDSNVVTVLPVERLQNAVELAALVPGGELLHLKP